MLRGGCDRPPTDSRAGVIPDALATLDRVGSFAAPFPRPGAVQDVLPGGSPVGYIGHPQLFRDRKGAHGWTRRGFETSAS